MNPIHRVLELCIVKSKNEGVFCMTLYAVETEGGMYQLRESKHHSCLCSVTSKDRFFECVTSIVSKYHRRGYRLDEESMPNKNTFLTREEEYKNLDVDLQAELQMYIDEGMKEYIKNRPQAVVARRIEKLQSIVTELPTTKPKKKRKVGVVTSEPERKRTTTVVSKVQGKDKIVKKKRTRISKRVSI